MFQINLSPMKHPDKMISYWKREWKTVLLVAVTGIIFDGFMSFVPIFQGKLLDSVIYFKDWSRVLHQAVIFLGVVLLLQFSRGIKRFGVRVFANKTGAVMRREIYHNILHRRFDELVREEAGDLLNKAVNDVDLCAEGMRKVTTETFDSGVLMLGYFTSLFIYDWKLTLGVGLFIPVALWIASRLKGIIVRYNKAARAQSSQVANLTYSDVEHIMLYRIDGVMDIRQSEYEKELQDLEQKSVKASVLETSMLPVYSTISMLGIGWLLYAGGSKVINGLWTVGTFTAYIAIFGALAVKASKASQLFNSFQKAVVSWKRLKPYYVNQETEMQNTPRSKKNDAGFNHKLNVNEQTREDALQNKICLSVSNLSFAYPDTDRKIFDGVSFKASSGQIVGITGSVASGKSSLGITLTGAYAYEGSIQINGMEMNTLSSEERSRVFSYQGHEPQLLTASIYENITLGKDGDIADVLNAVCFEDDLTTMPNGMKTIVGNKGVRLSGGQQARLALARALWQQSPIVILDDPFSAVDARTEEQILKNLKKQYAERIFIIISHRLMQFPLFHQIIYLENQSAVIGTHEALMGSCKEYRRLYEIQKGGEAHE